MYIVRNNMLINWRGRDYRGSVPFSSNVFRHFLVLLQLLTININAPLCKAVLKSCGKPENTPKTMKKGLRPLKINCAFWVRIFFKATSKRGKKQARWEKNSKLSQIFNQMDVCEKLNMKYNVRFFLPMSAKSTSEVTQNAQFILRGLMKKYSRN